MNQKQQPAGNLPKLSAPAQRALNAAGVYRLEQLTKVHEAEIARLHGIGPNALKQLRRALAANGLSFAGSPAIASSSYGM